jgi:tetratricopeptide (TPR) repeat protein
VEWKRAVALDGRLFLEAASLLVKVYERADLACALAGDNTSQLIHLEQILRETGGDTELLEAVSGRIAKLLEQECQEADAPAWEFAWLGQRYRREGRADEAIEMYRKTLAIEYNNVSCRFSLAQLLVERGLIPEALRELAIILRLQPQYAPGQSLLEELSRRKDSSRDAS